MFLPPDHCWNPERNILCISVVVFVFLVGVDGLLKRVGIAPSLNSQSTSGRQHLAQPSTCSLRPSSRWTWLILATDSKGVEPPVDGLIAGWPSLTCLTSSPCSDRHFRDSMDLAPPDGLIPLGRASSSTEEHHAVLALLVLLEG